MFKTLEDKALKLRRQVLEMCTGAGTGHVTSSFSCAEILTVLYHGGILRYDATQPEWPQRDRFILSKGQASPILYATLADLGFFPPSALKKFCKADGLLGGHLRQDVPGVEMTSGSPGQGLGIGAGMALAAKMNGESHLVFVLLGDGECYEGAVWESALFASHHQLANLVAIIDRNRLSASDFTEKIVRLNPLEPKWKSFGWDAITVDGHSFEELLSVLDGVRSRMAEKPLVILANTVKGKGVSFMENEFRWHGVAPQGDEAAVAKRELGISG